MILLILEFKFWIMQNSPAYETLSETLYERVSQKGSFGESHGELLRRNLFDFTWILSGFHAFAVSLFEMNFFTWATHHEVR